MVEKNSSCCETNHCHDSACIHTKRIMDSCLDKDCIEDLRVYLTKPSQQILDRSTTVRVRSAELLHVYIDVEPAVYKKGCYSLDLTFYYRILSDAMVCSAKPEILCGLAIFSKRVILFGGCGSTKIFTSQTKLCDLDANSIASRDLPQAVVEVLDPMILAARVVETCDHCRCETAQCDIPACIQNCFDSELVLSGENKRLQITIGQFSTIRLERDAQLRMPTLEYCIPEKECSDDTGRAEDPCELFSRINFPTEAFFPVGCNTSQEPCCSFDETERC